MLIRALIFGMLAGLMLVYFLNVAGAEEVDIALVLAVDVSSSISETEAVVQREGYAAALESPEVLRAIKDGLIGKIAVLYMEWSDVAHQRVVVDWTVIDGAETAAALAATLRAGKPKPGANTAIGHALAAAAGHLERAPVQPLRRVIDVSGDDQSNAGEPPATVRDAIIAQGVTINGLVIGSEYVADYFRRNVMGGPGAFVLSASTTDRFAQAVSAKLSLEIAGVMPGRQYAEAR